MHTIESYLRYAGLEHRNFSQLKMNQPLSSARIDSRLVKEGDVFFALRGQQQNGEDYIPSAIKNGAALIFASQSCEFKDDCIIKVDDVCQIFKTIVAARLKELGSKVIGITGSVGKTSTRNFCFAVLNEKYRVHKARGNYNTATGIMMTIMDAQDDTDIMLLEMGVDTVGEMQELVSIARPSIAIITNIGESHLERFGSREGIFREKSGIFKELTEEGCLIVRGGDEYLDRIKKGKFELKRLYRSSLPEGQSASSNYLVSAVRCGIEGTTFELKKGADNYHLRLKQIGEHMAFDAALAAILGLHLGLNEAEIKRGLLKTELEKMRFEVLAGSHFTVINDCYNSSFMSLKASLQTAITIKKTRLIAVIGDILEIGEDPALEHRKIGEELSQMDIDFIYFYGEGMKHAYQAYQNKALHFEREDLEGLEKSLLAEIKAGDLILCKASRSLALERVVDFLLNSF